MWLGFWVASFSSIHCCQCTSTSAVSYVVAVVFFSLCSSLLSIHVVCCNCFSMSLLISWFSSCYKTYFFIIMKLFTLLPLRFAHYCRLLLHMLYLLILPFTTFASTTLLLQVLILYCNCNTCEQICWYFGILQSWWRVGFLVYKEEGHLDLDVLILTLSGL